MTRGYYPIRVSDEEYRHMQEDEDAVDKRFKQVMMEGTERWIAMADDKLKGKVHRVIVCPANDDMFEIDPILQSGHVVEFGGEEPLDLEGFTMFSLGWTNPTPWDTFRELPDEQLGERVDAILEKVTDPGTTIFNFHAPPYGTGHRRGAGARRRHEHQGRRQGHAAGRLEVDPGRRASAYNRCCRLHGHIHESKGVFRLGKTLGAEPR